jgi:NAD(P)H-flavin reductase
MTAAPGGTVTAPLTTVPATVTRVRRQTHDVISLDVAPDGPDLAPFSAGQFDMLYAYGTGESAISISSDPRRGGRTYTVREVGAVTTVLNGLQPGSTIGVRGPFGRPWPLADAVGRDLLIVGGGIGLAPVRPAILAALHDRDRFDRVVVAVGARTPRDLVFRDDLAAWAAEPRVELVVTVDRAARGWDGEVGLVTEPLADLGLRPRRTTLFACGPELMMTAVVDALLDAGAAAEHLFVTLERNMRCGVGTCGHCQLGPAFVCREGPVFAWDEVAHLLVVPEL